MPDFRVFGANSISGQGNNPENKSHRYFLRAVFVRRRDGELKRRAGVSRDRDHGVPAPPTLSTPPSNHRQDARSEAVDSMATDEATARIWSAVTDPEILIGTFAYLLLKPLLRNSRLVDEKKGAYRKSMIWSVTAAAPTPRAHDLPTARTHGLPARPAFRQALQRLPLAPHRSTPPAPDILWLPHTTPLAAPRSAQPSAAPLGTTWCSRSSQRRVSS